MKNMDCRIQLPEMEYLLVEAAMPYCSSIPKREYNSHDVSRLDTILSLALLKEKKIQYFFDSDSPRQSDVLYVK